MIQDVTGCIEAEWQTDLARAAAGLAVHMAAQGVKCSDHTVLAAFLKWEHDIMSPELQVAVSAFKEATKKLFRAVLEDLVEGTEAEIASNPGLSPRAACVRHIKNTLSQGTKQTDTVPPVEDLRLLKRDPLMEEFFDNFASYMETHPESASQEQAMRKLCDVATTVLLQGNRAGA